MNEVNKLLCLLKWSDVTAPSWNLEQTMTTGTTQNVCIHSTVGRTPPVAKDQQQKNERCSYKVGMQNRKWRGSGESISRIGSQEFEHHHSTSVRECKEGQFIVTSHTLRAKADDEAWQFFLFFIITHNHRFLSRWPSHAAGNGIH